MLEVYDSATPAPFPIVFHNGTPGGLVPFPAAIEAAAAVGLRLITYGRPGYGRSELQRGRSVSDAAADTAEILDQLGFNEFVTVGWSGGGPHALACAALLPGRCLAAATIAGVAPFDAENLCWTEGMGEENVEEAELVRAGGRDALVPLIAAQAAELAEVSASGVATALGGLVPDIDKNAITGAFADWLAASFRKAVSTGNEGWLDDCMAIYSPWGFDVATLATPVAIWQGGEDLMVPFTHGQWLAAQIPTARAHLFPEQGHLSLAVDHLPAIYADLAALGLG